MGICPQERKRQHINVHSQATSHVPLCDLGMEQRHGSHLPLAWFLIWRPTEKWSPSGIYCKESDLHGSIYRLVKVMAFEALCESLGSAESLSCKPDRFLPAQRPLDHGPCLGTDTTCDNNIDCSIFEVVITGLVEGHWANVISDGARWHTSRLTSDIFHQSLWYFSPWCSLVQSHLQSAVVLLHSPSYPGIPSAVGHLSGQGCWAPFSTQPHLVLPLYSHSCLYPSEQCWRKHTWPQDCDSQAQINTDSVMTSAGTHLIYYTCENCKVSKLSCKWYLAGRLRGLFCSVFLHSPQPWGTPAQGMRSAVDHHPNSDTVLTALQFSLCFSCDGKARKCRENITESNTKAIAVGSSLSCGSICCIFLYSLAPCNAKSKKVPGCFSDVELQEEFTARQPDCPSSFSPSSAPALIPLRCCSSV